MVVSCCAYGYMNDHGSRKGLGFLQISSPARARGRRWITVVKRKGWMPTKHTRICGDHFTAGVAYILGALWNMAMFWVACVLPLPSRTYQAFFLYHTGKPVDDPSHVEYVPTVFVYQPRMAEAVSRQRNERQERAIKRRQLATEQSESQVTATEALMMPLAAETHSSSSTQAPTVVDCDASAQTTENIMIPVSTQTAAIWCQYTDKQHQSTGSLESLTIQCGINWRKWYKNKILHWTTKLGAFSVCLLYSCHPHS